MKKLIVPVFLLCFFFTFLIGTIQGSYDRIAPQFLALSVVNLVASAYLIYNYKISSLVKDFKRSKTVISYSLFILISLISLNVAFNKSESIITLSQYLTFYITFLIVYLISLKSKLNFFKTFIILTIISITIECYGVISTAIDYFIINGNEFQRSNLLRGYSGNINIVSFSLVLKSPILIYLIFKSDNKYLIAYLSFLLFGLSLVIFMLMSRGAFLSYILCLFSILSFIIFNQFAHNFKKIILIIAVTLFSYVATDNYINQYGDDALVERIESITDTDDPSINSRLRYYNDAIYSIKSNPIIGIGIGNWKFYSILYDYEDMRDYIVPVFVHNDFLQVAAEIGVLGLIAYLFIFIFPISNLLGLLKKRKNTLESFILLVIIGVYIIDSMLNFPISRPISHIYVIFVLILSLKNKFEINA